MIGQRRQADPEVASGASPFAWLLLGLCHVFWLVFANGFLFWTTVVWHASRSYDPSVGKTYLLSDHGRNSWIRPHDFVLYGQVIGVGMGGMFLSVILMLMFIKASTVRYMAKQPTSHVVTVVLLIVSILCWCRVRI